MDDASQGRAADSSNPSPNAAMQLSKPHHVLPLNKGQQPMGYDSGRSPNHLPWGVVGTGASQTRGNNMIMGLYPAGPPPTSYSGVAPYSPAPSVLHRPPFIDRRYQVDRHSNYPCCVAPPFTPVADTSAY